MKKVEIKEYYCQYNANNDVNIIVAKTISQFGFKKPFVENGALEIEDEKGVIFSFLDFPERRFRKVYVSQMPTEKSLDMKEVSFL